MSTPQQSTTSTVTKTTVVQKTVTAAAGAKKPKKAIIGGAKKKRVHSHRNAELGTTGLMRFSRGRMFHRRAIWRIGKWKQDQAKLKETTKKTKTKKPALPATATTTATKVTKRSKKQSRGMKKKNQLVVKETEKSDLPEQNVFHVIIQQKNDRKSFVLNVKHLVNIHDDFVHH